MDDDALYAHPSYGGVNRSRDLIIVEITLNDGTVLSDRVTDVRGTVDNPMTREEVIQKCRDLVEPVLGKANCTSLIDKILGIEKVQDIRELRSVLQKA